MRKNILLVIAAALSLLFASCAAGPNTQSGALTGAALGGLAGAIIGNNVGDRDGGDIFTGRRGRGGREGGGLTGRNAPPRLQTNPQTGCSECSRL